MRDLRDPKAACAINFRLVPEEEDMLTLSERNRLDEEKLEMLLTPGERCDDLSG